MKRLNPRGHGGRRPNQTGRPKKPKAPPLVIVEAESAEDAVVLARKYSPLAVKILVTIASKGERESARVAAAAKILEIARGGPADDPALIREAELNRRTIEILNRQRLN